MGLLHLKWVRDRITLDDAMDLYNIKGILTVCEDGQVKDIEKECYANSIQYRVLKKQL